MTPRATSTCWPERPVSAGNLERSGVFYLRYLVAELRRRKSRTILTSLGLAVGVGMVATITALSKGLADAQSRVLAPLTGVGTDMTVIQPLALTPDEESARQRENAPAQLDMREVLSMRP